MTRGFWKIDRQNRKLENGHTWLFASAQRNVVNSDAKYLILGTAFEEMRIVRVHSPRDHAKSRAAILRLGAKEECVVRHERIMPGGRKRNSVRYSIIGDDGRRS